MLTSSNLKPDRISRSKFRQQLYKLTHRISHSNSVISTSSQTHFIQPSEDLSISCRPSSDHTWIEIIRNRLPLNSQDSISSFQNLSTHTNLTPIEELHESSSSSTDQIQFKPFQYLYQRFCETQDIDNLRDLRLQSLDDFARVYLHHSSSRPLPTLVC